MEIEVFMRKFMRGFKIKCVKVYMKLQLHIELL